MEMMKKAIIAAIATFVAATVLIPFFKCGIPLIKDKLNRRKSHEHSQPGPRSDRKE